MYAGLKINRNWEMEISPLPRRKHCIVFLPIYKEGYYTVLQSGRVRTHKVDRKATKLGYNIIAHTLIVEGSASIELVRTDDPMASRVEISYDELNDKWSISRLIRNLVGEFVRQDI